MTTVKVSAYETILKPERAVLVGVQIRSVKQSWELEETLEELAALAASCGVETVGTVMQKLNHPAMMYLGSGKMDELKSVLELQNADVAIFDDELSSTQQFAIEKYLKVKVIDRTALILDIFARRAKTKEGQLQVEQAQAKYLLPRLAGQWAHLERMGGGIGTRGPGETQIETDRNLVRRRLIQINKEIAKVATSRKIQSKRRALSTFSVALVGYTNSGKSTLFNSLTKADTLKKDQLFSTLDTTVRRLRLPSGKPCVLSDTVGFINKLPPILIAAFKATLEEAIKADILLHVVDISSKHYVWRTQSVDEILNEMGLEPKIKILVINKVDKLNIDEATQNELITSTHSLGRYQKIVGLSALTGWNMNTLKLAVDDLLGSKILPA